jgi:hypothetical protein
MLSREDSRVFGIGLIVGDRFEGLARDKAGASMRLAFGIVFFVVAVKSVASRRIDCYDHAHFYEWNLEVSVSILYMAVQVTRPVCIVTYSRMKSATSYIAGG